MPDTYMIETGSEIAGIVIREGRRFRFFSSSRRFWELEGEYYRNPREAERAARGLLADRRSSSEVLRRNIIPARPAVSG